MHPIPSRRGRRAVARATLALAATCGSAAQADVLFQESFSAGPGRFTASGAVSTGTFGARLTGAFGSGDGALVSQPFATSGFTAITLTLNRSSSGLDAGEAGIIEYSTNGTTWTVLESSRTASGGASIVLPAAAANQAAVRLRLRVDASSSLESFTVAALRVDGTGGTGPNPPTGARDPGTGPWALVSPANVATECRLDPALLQQANRTLGLAWAVVRYGKLCHEYLPNGTDPASQVYSTTKTMGALTVGALVHHTRGIPVTATRKRGPVGEFQRVDHWIDNIAFQQAATTAHVLAMVSDASPNLNYPNREFQYDTVGSDAINRLSDLVNAAVVQDTARLGSNIGQFWRRHLATPLGLQSSAWGNSDASKNFATSWTTTLRDMARIGLLMNNGGVWNGQRLVDEQFLYNLAHPSFEDANTGYGYLTWLNEDDPCAPKPIHRAYPHGPVSNAPSCGRAEGCTQTHDAGVFYAAGLGGQYIVVHRALDLVIVVKNSGGQSGSEPRRFWEALRPAVLAHDPVYAGNSTGFCAAYGRGNHAPDLKLWEGGR